MDLEKALADLHALPPEEFIAGRNRLAAELKQAGDPRAAEVKVLRKPGMPVWIANLLARREPNLVTELLAVGDRLRAAHSSLLAGGEPEQVRTLATEEREIVGRLVARARQILDDEGLRATPGTMTRVEATLLGLATDPEASTSAAAGRLQFEPVRGGFSQAAPSVEPKDVVVSARRAQEIAAGSRRRAQDLGARAEELARQAAELQRAAQQAAGRAEEARAAAAEAEAAAERAEREAADVDR